MKPKSLVRFIVLIIAITLLFIIGFSSTATADAAIDSQTNAYRVSQGKTALVTTSSLQTVVNRRLQESITYWQHPTNWSPYFSMLPSCVTGLGENLAYITAGYGGSGWPVDAWIASPGHRANMLGDWHWQASAKATVWAKSPATGKYGNFTFAVQMFAQGCYSKTAVTTKPIATKAPATPRPPVIVVPIAPKSAVPTVKPVLLPNTAIH